MAKSDLKQYMITFNGEGGDVEIAHNYKLNLYKRNVPAMIDENYLAVLKDAVVTTTVKDEKGVEKNIRIPMYSYEIEAI